MHEIHRFILNEERREQLASLDIDFDRLIYIQKISLIDKLIFVRPSLDIVSIGIVYPDIPHTFYADKICAKAKITFTRSFPHFINDAVSVAGRF